MGADGSRCDVPASIERLLCDDPDVEFAVLFGSRATGDAGQGSDLDIAVQFSDELSAGDRFRKRCRLSGRAQRTGTPFVDLTDLEELPLEVAHAAVDGKLLCGDTDAFDAFRAQIEAAYDDQRDDIEQRRRDTISRIATGGLRG